jgi:cytochrome b pre-mRNA-processing protein 3
MGLRFFERRRQAADAARALYERAVAQARQPGFYTALGVPDSLDGRFDLVAVHVFLLLYRLKRERAAAAPLAQCLFDVMFDDMDESLRELGVGDLGVGWRVKAMAKALYGRLAAYEAGLAGDDRSWRRHSPGTSLAPRARERTSSPPVAPICAERRLRWVTSPMRSFATAGCDSGRFRHCKRQGARTRLERRKD